MSKRYVPPPWFVAKIMNPVVMALGLSGATTLAVKGRSSGLWRTVPVNVIKHAGDRYLVAPRGNTHWARNLQAAGGGELRSRRGAEAFKAVEVPVAERPPILDSYRRAVTVTEGIFAELPDPADHP